jgi:ABC-type multidrug transport system ATPase subunit
MTMRCSLIEISKRYGRQWALRSVTLAAAPGEIVGIVGPNGAGKTTLLRIAARLVGQQSGTVDVPPGATRALRYFAGERTLPPDVRAQRWRRLWGLSRDQGIGRKRIGALSRGMRQRLGLETVLAQPQSASLVLLDEPWEGLDPDASRWLSEQLAGLRLAGAAVIVSSHRIHDLATVCDRCVFINVGRVTREVDVTTTFPSHRAAVLLEAFELSREKRES